MIRSVVRWSQRHCVRIGLSGPTAQPVLQQYQQQSSPARPNHPCERVFALGGRASIPATNTVIITPATGPPLVVAGNTTIYTEQEPAIAISPLLTVSDGDNTNLAGAAVWISNGLFAGDTLGFAHQNSISGSYDTGTGVLTLSGSSSVTNYQAALRSVTFSSTSDNPTDFRNQGRPHHLLHGLRRNWHQRAPAISTIIVIPVSEVTAGAGNPFRPAAGFHIFVKAILRVRAGHARGPAAMGG
jgi:hypothetical protein